MEIWPAGAGSRCCIKRGIYSGSEGGKVGTENEVRLFDEVIVEGSDLGTGKCCK